MKRIVALFLCVLMLLALLPLSVWADEEPEAELPVQAVEPDPAQQDHEPVKEKLLPEPEPAKEEPPEKSESFVEELEASAEQSVESAVEPSSEIPEPVEKWDDIQNVEEEIVNNTESELKEEEATEPASEEKSAESEADTISEEAEITVEQDITVSEESIPVIQLQKLQNAVIKDGCAKLVCKASVDTEDIPLLYQWQRLDTVKDPENWEDLPGETRQILRLKGINDFSIFENLLFRCRVTVGKTVAFTNGAKLTASEPFDGESTLTALRGDECEHLQKIEEDHDTDYCWSEEITDNGNGTHTAWKREVTEYYCPDCYTYFDEYGEPYQITEKHDFVDGICWVCDAKYCKHTHISSDPRTYYDTDESYDNHDGTHTTLRQEAIKYVCLDCGEEWEEEEEWEEVTEKHKFDDEGICWICDAVNTCEHENGSYLGTYGYEVSDNGDGTHSYVETEGYYYCADCETYYYMPLDIPEVVYTEKHFCSFGYHCAVCDALMPFTGKLSIEPAYVFAEPGKPQHITVSVEPEEYKGFVQISVDEGSEGILYYDEDEETVTGLEPGKTGYLLATLTLYGKVTTVRCRVDVAKEDPSMQDQVKAVQLITSAVTTEVFKTDYAKITILPVLEQNGALGKIKAEDLWSVESARFNDPVASDYFELRPLNDRTLEIIPTDEAIEAAKSGDKALKAAFTSTITVEICGKEFVTEGALKLTVKKSKPTIKAKALSFNSLTAGESYGLAFTGGQVVFVEPDEVAAAKAKVPAVPGYIELNGMQASIVPDNQYAAKGNLYLLATVEGWAEPFSVKVPFTVKAIAPKLTFSPKSATIQPGSWYGAPVEISVSPSEYWDSEKYPIEIEKVEFQDGKTYIELFDDSAFCAEIYDDDPNWMYLYASSLMADGKPHNYRVTLSCAGKTFTYPVKVLASNALPKLTLKASGNINTKVSGSSVSVACSIKTVAQNAYPDYYLVSIKQMKGKTVICDDVRDLFKITQGWDLFTFEEKEPGSLESDYTYQAVIGADITGNSVPDVTASTNLKITFATAAPAISVSMKAYGGIDVTRPGSRIVLVPSATNYYGDAKWEIVFTDKTGEVPAPFNVFDDDGIFYLTADTELTAATSNYSAFARIVIDGKTYTTKPVKLKVTQGKLKLTSSIKAAELYMNDRFSQVIFTLDAGDDTVAPIERLELDAASANTFEVVNFTSGSNTFALKYRNNESPATFKNGTVKLAVYVKGCDKPVATVPLKVTYK